MGGEPSMNKKKSLLIAEAWAQRAQAELGAEARFQLLSEQLNNAGSHEQVIYLSKKAQEDERRHAQLCAEVAREYGHKTGFEKIKRTSQNLEKSWSKKESFRDRLLCEVTLMCCITETFNASLLNTIYKNVSSNSSRGKVIHEILKDEVKHSQIGWAHLAFESQKKDCGFLAEHLEEMLEISVNDDLFLPVVESHELEDTFSHGVMPVEQRLEQFETTLKQVIVPGFQEFNIDTHQIEKWLKGKKSPHGEMVSHYP